MNFELSDVQREIARVCREFAAKELTPNARRWDERHEWPAWVGFTPAPLRRPLLGFAGCLQFFTATFSGDREQVELDANALYPGT